MKPLSALLQKLFGHDAQAQHQVDARLRRAAQHLSREDLPPGLHERIMRAVQRADAAELPRRPRLRVAWAAAMVTVLVLIGWGIIANRPSPPPQASLAPPPTPHLVNLEAQAPRVALLPAEYLTASMENEVVSLVGDLSRGAAFVRECLPTQ